MKNPVAWAYVNSNGTIQDGEETWNPRGLACARLKVSEHGDVGIYDIEAPEGITLLGGDVDPQVTPGVVGVVEAITDGRFARVHLTQSAGEVADRGKDIDCAFIVKLFEPVRSA